MFSRLTFCVFLVLSLAITSLTMAQAHGASVATGQMVICTGMGTSVVYLDAQGQPTSAPHVCPDCLMAAAPDGAPTPYTLARTFRHAAPLAQLTQRPRPPISPRTPPSRAPPLSV